MRIKSIGLIAVLIWMGVIYFFSTQPRQESLKLSTGIARETLTIGKQLGMVAPGAKGEKKALGAWGETVRGIAHAVFYLVLALLAMFALRRIGVSRRNAVIASFVLSVGYAGLDEFHQTFVPGRGFEPEDFVLDCVGVVLGIALYGAGAWLSMGGAKRT